MPSHFVIDAKHGIVVSIGKGVFTQADFIEHMSRLRVDPGFNPEFNQVVDCREIEFMDLTAAQIEALANRTIFARQSRCAFVVSSDLQFGLGRMFSAYRESAGYGPNVEVFRKWEEALSWLNLPTDLDLIAPEKPAPEYSV